MIDDGVKVRNLDEFLTQKGKVEKLVPFVLDDKMNETGTLLSEKEKDSESFEGVEQLWKNHNTYVKEKEIQLHEYMKKYMKDQSENNLKLKNEVKKDESIVKDRIVDKKEFILMIKWNKLKKENERLKNENLVLKKNLKIKELRLEDYKLDFKQHQSKITELLSTKEKLLNFVKAKEIELELMERKLVDNNAVINAAEIKFQELSKINSKFVEELENNSIIIKEKDDEIEDIKNKYTIKQNEINELIHIIMKSTQNITKVTEDSLYPTKEKPVSNETVADIPKELLQKVENKAISVSDETERSVNIMYYTKDNICLNQIKKLGDSSIREVVREMSEADYDFKTEVSEEVLGKIETNTASDAVAAKVEQYVAHDFPLIKISDPENVVIMLRKFNLNVTKTVRNILLSFYKQDKNIGSREEFINLCKKFSSKFREDLKESYRTCKESLEGIYFTQANRDYIKLQIEKYFEKKSSLIKSNGVVNILLKE